MQNDNNTNNGPQPGNPDMRGPANQQSTPTKDPGQNPRPRPPSLEEIILEDLRLAARKAGAELIGVVVPTRIAEAEELLARRESKATIVKAINYAKGIAAEKKFRGYHLLRELGIKLPSDNDGTGENAADKSKARRKTAPAQQGKAQPDQGKAGSPKPDPGNAGEAKS